MMKERTDVSVFCENIGKLRKKERLSKAKMAKKLGIGIRSLEKLESGILPKRLSSRILLDIYQAFGITSNEMLSKWG